MSESMRYLPLDEEQLESALRAWLAETPEMSVLALVPEAEKDGVALLQGLCCQLHIPLHGGLFPALVTDRGFVTQGCCLLRFPKPVPAFLLADLNAPGKDPAWQIAKTVEGWLDASAASEKPTLYLLFDALLPNIASMIDALYLHLADRVAYAGVNAGSETFLPQPCLFNEAALIGNGVLGMLWPGEPVTVLAHAYPLPDRLMSASSTDGNRIITIDWRPAFEVYQEIIKAEYGIDLTQDNFYQYAVHFPFGILRATDEVVVRVPVARDEAGSLICVGEVPENAVLVLLRAPSAEAAHCITHLAEGLQRANGSLQGRALLTFYCAGRRMHLGADAVGELLALQRATGVATQLGALSLGEVGSTNPWGYPMFHNAALVCTPWP